MFSKKCPKCENKIKKDYNFCPHCSSNLKSDHDTEDYGFLGKDDIVEENMSFTDNLMEKMFNSAMKLFEKQMRNMHNEMNRPRRNNPRNNDLPGLNVQFFVNGEKVFPERQNQSQPLIKINNNMPKDKIKKFSKLPKKEPKSKIKRLSGKVIYELLVPGVKNIDDVLINKLENSVEIKALSNNAVYSKNLNVNLPILRYHLINDTLFVEMQAR